VAQAGREGTRKPKDEGLIFYHVICGLEIEPDRVPDLFPIRGQDGNSNAIALGVGRAVELKGPMGPGENGLWVLLLLLNSILKWGSRWCPLDHKVCNSLTHNGVALSKLKIKFC
jgi:hypothetical protein